MEYKLNVLGWSQPIPACHTEIPSSAAAALIDKIQKFCQVVSSLRSPFNGHISDMHDVAKTDMQTNKQEL